MLYRLRSKTPGFAKGVSTEQKEPKALKQEKLRQKGNHLVVGAASGNASLARLRVISVIHRFEHSPDRRIMPLSRSIRLIRRPLGPL